MSKYKCLPYYVFLLCLIPSFASAWSIGSIGKGTVITAHNAISATAPGTALNFSSYHAAQMVVEVTGSGEWSVELTGAPTESGTYASMYVGRNRQIRYGITATTSFVLNVESPWVKCVATEVSGSATVTVYMIPLVQAAETTVDQREWPILTTTDVVFANSDPANTQVVVTLTRPFNPSGKVEIFVKNPSTVTDLTCKIFNTATTLGGGTVDCYLTSIAIPKSQTITGTSIGGYVFIVEGLYNGKSAKLVFSNDTVLGGAEGFTGAVEIMGL